MDIEEIRRGREAIVLGDERAPYGVVLFHGYTGSTRDFNDLPERIAEKLSARVYVPLLPGHGTRVEELLPLDLDAFARAADLAVAEIKREGRTLAFGGHSFGAYLAILAAQKYENAALFTSVIPYELRFPYSSIIGRTISRSKKLWAKRLSPEEWEARSGVFFYPQMPGKALSLVHEARRRIRRASLVAPMFTIHAENDTLAHATESVDALTKLTSGPHESHIVHNGSHSVFFSQDHKDEVASRIIDFLERSFHA